MVCEGQGSSFTSEAFICVKLLWVAEGIEAPWQKYPFRGRRRNKASLGQRQQWSPDNIAAAPTFFI